LVWPVVGDPTIGYGGGKELAKFKVWPRFKMTFRYLCGRVGVVPRFFCEGADRQVRTEIRVGSGQ
jgi:hypothetical protein